MNQGRVIPITAGAAASTFMLFYLMQGLVASNQLDLPDEPKYLSFDGVLSQPKTDPARETERLERPEPVEIKPVDPKPVPTDGDFHPDFDLTTLEPPQSTDTGLDRDFGLGMVDGGQIPLVRVQPNYPPRALENGTEGWVMVEFTVGALGDVQNPVVIDAEPKGTFDRSALQAVLKFKYKPTVIDGRAVPTPGVRFRVVYSIDKG